MSAIHYRQVIDRLIQYRYQLQLLLSNKESSKIHPYSNPISLSNEFSNIMSSSEEVIAEVEQKERKKHGNDDDDNEDT